MRQGGGSKPHRGEESARMVGQGGEAKTHREEESARQVGLNEARRSEEAPPG